MKLPNKVTSYRKSSLFYISDILTLLSKKDYPVVMLFEEFKLKMSLQDFVDALVCLFALKQIILRKEIIHYVKRDPLKCF